MPILGIGFYPDLRFSLGVLYLFIFFFSSLGAFGHFNFSGKSHIWSGFRPCECLQQIHGLRQSKALGRAHWASQSFPLLSISSPLLLTLVTGNFISQLLLLHITCKWLFKHKLYQGFFFTNISYILQLYPSWIHNLYIVYILKQFLHT